MNDIAIHGLDPIVETRLRARAAEHGRSVADEAGEILRAALGPEEVAVPGNLYDWLRARFEPLGGTDDVVPPKRQPVREPPTFD